MKSLKTAGASESALIAWRELAAEKIVPENEDDV
jgi:DNA-directed RNA polymerase subunit K/omega